VFKFIKFLNGNTGKENAEKELKILVKLVLKLGYLKKIKNQRESLLFLIKKNLAVKGVLNPNFRPFNFELKKKKIFKMNFDLSFKVL